jgi:hypothetical protein
MATAVKIVSAVTAAIWGLLFCAMLFLSARSLSPIRAVDAAFMAVPFAIMGLALLSSIIGTHRTDWLRLTVGVVLLAAGIACWFVVAAASTG